MMAALEPRAAERCSSPIFGYDSRMKKQIAIVEDEPALRENYSAALARHG
jgi:hypothetical protein